MPRSKINISDKIEYLSILDEKGTVDKTLEPKIPNTLLIKLYRSMLLTRRFDERLLSLQRQGRIGTFPPITGQEAAHMGAAAVLRPSDWMVPSFRETGAELWRGRSLESIFLYNAGFSEGARIAEDRNDLPVSIPVGSQILHAVGLGWAIKYRQKKDVAMTFFGDGGSSQGDFHEGLNFAGVFKTPVVFVCQNNQWAISIPRSKQTRSATIAQKAIAYGIYGIQVDGNDILAVYAAADEAVNRARSGQGATLIESVTYRVAVHTTADDPSRYRSDEEVETWRKRDPLIRFQKYLTAKRLLTKKKVEAFEAETADKIQTAVDRAEEKLKDMGNPLDIFDHVYAVLPPQVAAQREQFAKEQAETEQEGHHG
jgi:pyruvate dehydrogenase E1 component alpha subunit